MSRFGWKQLLFIIPIIIVVILLTNRQIEPPPTASPQSSDSQESDFYLRQVHIIHMGKEGTVESELFAEQLTHYPYDDHSELSSPRFVLHRANGEQVWIESREGTIHGRERIVLSRDVNMEQRTSDNQTTNRIQGSEIEFERATQKITSRKPITVTGKSYTIVAGAMELLSNEKRLNLSRGVEGHYAP